MKLIINGQSKDFLENLTLQDVIENLQVQDKVMAAAVNMDIVKKDNWSSFRPKENDAIELLNFVGGG